MIPLRLRQHSYLRTCKSNIPLFVFVVLMFIPVFVHIHTYANMPPLCEDDEHKSMLFMPQFLHTDAWKSRGEGCWRFT